MALYRQLAWRLHFHGTDGAARQSDRPRAGGAGTAFLDLPPREPTLVEIGPTDRVDVGELLRIGAIVPYEPPEPSPPEGGEST